MDRAGIATTMIVPLIADTKILAERIAEAKARGVKPDRDELIHQLAAEQSAYNSWAAAAAHRHAGRFAGLIGLIPYCSARTGRAQRSRRGWPKDRRLKSFRCILASILTIQKWRRCGRRLTGAG